MRTKYDLRNYCIRERLCTGADCGQYAVILSLFETIDYNLHDIAVMIWFSSITEKNIADIEKDLEELSKE